MKSNLYLHKLSRDALREKTQELLQLEPYWTSAGESLWDEESLFLEVPGKFDMSFYAEMEGKIVGYLIGSEYDYMTGKLNKIVVHPDLRGNGVGGKLWDSLLDECRKREFKKLEFRVLPENLDAINLYRKKGCIFDGMTNGTDGKTRHNVHYFFKTRETIPHSRLTIDENDIDAVLRQVLSRQYANGPVSEKLVSWIGNPIQKFYGVATNSGANAIFISLRAAGIGTDHEVILPSYVCGSVLHAIETAGAKPVFSDIQESGFCISYDDVREKVNEKTRAIIVPHLFGRFAEDIEKIKSLEKLVIEDCAHSLGTECEGIRAGRIGDISIYSFYPTKMAASFSGGLALTNDEMIAKKMQSLLQTDKREKWGEAYSMRMDDVTAALALSQVKKVSQFADSRKKIAEEFTKFLHRSDFFLPRMNEGGVFFRYVIRHPEAEKIIANLNLRGIGATRPIFMPLHRYYGISDSLFPNSTRTYNEAISLPIYPKLTRGELGEIVGSLLNWRYEHG